MLLAIHSPCCVVGCKQRFVFDIGEATSRVSHMTPCDLFMWCPVPCSVQV